MCSSYVYMHVYSRKILRMDMLVRSFLNTSSVPVFLEFKIILKFLPILPPNHHPISNYALLIKGYYSFYLQTLVHIC